VGDRPFERCVHETTDAGLDHDHRDQVSARLSKAPQADETFELAGHVSALCLVERIWVLSVV